MHILLSVHVCVTAGEIIFEYRIDARFIYGTHLLHPARQYMYTWWEMKGFNKCLIYRMCGCICGERPVGMLNGISVPSSYSIC